MDLSLDYRKTEHGNAVVRLFREIYPHWSPEQISRAVYDENTPLHVATKIALVDDTVAGQANVFRLQNNESIANLGFHVHPRYQRRGTGHKLAAEVLDVTGKKRRKNRRGQTEKDNIASLRLAEKLEFTEAASEFIEKNTNALKIPRLKHGFVLRKNL